MPPDDGPELDERAWQRDPWFTWPERVPWSQLGVDVMRAWGRADPADPQPEHLEIVGPSGSGKTHALCTLLQDRYRTRKTAATLICTKPADGTIHKLGWPITDDFDEAARRGWTNFVYWPRTRRMGHERREFHEQRIAHVLHKLWRPNANRIVAFDEVGYVESLSGDVKALVQQYWREARSQGITVAAMKQRPQGAVRDMHSETYWTMAFPPKDRSDLERFAELLGHRRDWMPVFNTLDQDRREFLVRHSRSREAYITWIDTPLTPQKVGRRGPLWLRALRGERAA
jgi:nucleoside-triphosphatase THEP1